MARAAEQHGGQQGEDVAHGEAQAKKVGQRSQRLELTPLQNSFSDARIRTLFTQLASTGAKLVDWSPSWTSLNASKFRSIQPGQVEPGFQVRSGKADPGWQVRPGFASSVRLRKLTTTSGY